MISAVQVGNGSACRNTTEIVMKFEKTPASPTAAAQAQPSRASGDAAPSNTASHKCSNPYFLPLRWGVDSLYLSYSGSLHHRVEKELSKLKAFAQSQEQPRVVLAQYPVEGHVFAVRDKGAGLFPYVLDDFALRLQLSKHLSKLPLAYVKVSSDYLAAHEPEDASIEAYSVVSHLGDCRDFGKVGRIDLFVDFVTNVDLESWDRTAWVTRASAINAYSVDGEFSGWAVGVGGAIAARLYNKTLEIQKSHKDYLKGLWLESGWDGSASVWRLEMQLKREVLGQLGLRTVDEVLNNLGGIWAYSTTEWLRLSIPSPSDSTRSRWPVHPLWDLLASVDWETPGGPLLRGYPEANVPDDGWIFQAGLRPIVSYMGKNRYTDFHSALPRFLDDMVAFLDEEAHRKGLGVSDYVQERAQQKIREYGTGYNLEDVPSDDPRRRELDVHEEEIRERARAYRKQTNG